MPWNRVLDLTAPIIHHRDNRRIPEFELGLLLKLARMSIPRALWNMIVEPIYVMLCFRRARMGELACK